MQERLVEEIQMAGKCIWTDAWSLNSILNTGNYDSIIGEQ